MNVVARIVPSTVWTLHTARCVSRLRSTAQIFVSGLLVTCFSIFGGLANCFSTGVCNHHCFPRRTREGLPTSPRAGTSRPVSRHLSQLQHVPVQTLSRMLPVCRSFH